MLPDPGLHLVLDPEDAIEHVQFLHDLAGPEDRLLVAISPGADNKRIVGYDILRALGKGSELIGVDRSSREMWLRAQLWLEVSGVKDLFVTRAHLLPPWMLGELALLAIRADTRLWLVAQVSELNQSRNKFFATWPFERLRWSDFATRWAPPTTPQKARPKTQRRSRADLLPDVPIDDFTTFRASCRDLLSDEAFAAVDAEFLAGLDASCAYLDSHRDETITETMICDFVRDLIADIDWLPQLFARVRGCQAGALRAGYLMKVQLDVLSATSVARARLDEASIDILSRYSAPRYGAAAMLVAATGCQLDALTAMNLSDVSSDSRKVLIDGKSHSLPDGAAAMVEVLVRERLAQRAEDDDPLFVYIKGTGRRYDKLHRWTPRGMYDNLKKIERESGLLLTSHLLNAGQRDAVNWARRRGISLQPISSNVSNTNN